MWKSLLELKEANWVCNYSPCYFKSDSAELAECAFELAEASLRFIAAPVPEILPVTLPTQDCAALHITVVDVINSLKDSPELASDKLVKLYSRHEPGEVVVNVRTTQAILGELMKLPKPQQPLAFYSSLLIKLANATAAEGTYIQLVHRAGLEILNKAAELDLEIADRLCKIFAHFVSNFETSWRWDQYAELTLAEDSERLLKDWLDQLSRLVSYERLSQDIPESLRPLLPAEPEPKLKFTEIEESVENTDCQLIIDRINSKATTQLMKTLLTSKEICNSGNFLYLIFCECLFFQGAKSFTHITTYISRYLDVIKIIPSTVLLEALYEVWGDCLHRIEAILVKLMKLGLITPADLVSFVLRRLKEDPLNNLNKSEWKVIGLAFEEHRLKADETTDLLELISTHVAPTDFARMLCFLRTYLSFIDVTAISQIEGRFEGDFKEKIEQLKAVKGLL